MICGDRVIRKSDGETGGDPFALARKPVPPLVLSDGRGSCSIPLRIDAKSGSEREKLIVGRLGAPSFGVKLIFDGTLSGWVPPLDPSGGSSSVCDLLRTVACAISLRLLFLGGGGGSAGLNGNPSPGAC